MLNIKVSVRPVLAEIFKRQIAGDKRFWGNCRFYINTPVNKCDWWVVFHNSALVETETTLCDPKHIVYFSMEPIDSWLPKHFLDQFSHLVLCDRKIRHPNIIYKNGLNWWVGIQVKYEGVNHRFTPKYTLDYDTLSSMIFPEKEKSISIVCSNKSFMPGHKKRLNFLEKLKAHPISEHIDFYGGGIKPIGDKWDAIAPYKYHIVLENSILQDYWSEKLADSFLGFAYPVYFGCPNIYEYFSKDALQLIDMDNFDNTVAVLEKLANNDLSQRQVAAINIARHQVLNYYNIFQLVSDICTQPAEKVSLCQLSPRTFYEIKKKNFFLNKTKLYRFVRKFYLTSIH
jgi:hypothetical protein